MEIDEDDVPMDNERIDDEILDVFEPLPRFTTDADTSQALLYLPVRFVSFSVLRNGFLDRLQVSGTKHGQRKTHAV